MSLSNINSKNKIYLFASLLFLVVIVFLGYFTNREETIRVYALFVIMFVCYWLLTRHTFSITTIVFTGLALRLSQLVMLPNLSDDYFRFIWDGQLLKNGINPFYHLPTHFIALDTPPLGITQYLFDNLNSPEYFTVYPPVCQFTFWFAAIIAKQHILGNVVVMRLFLLLAETGTLLILPKLLKKIGQDPAKTSLYAFNPMVIVELTGNLHYEALMIFFLCLTIYLLIKNKIILAALALSCSISSKLLPLMFLPLFFFYLGYRKVFTFYLFTGIGSIILFIGFLDFDMLQNMGESVNLYFKRFEFNASIYYVVRWIGYQVIGYNIIETAGARLTFIPIILIAILSLFKTKNAKELIAKMLFVLSVYFFTATIIHPWYVTTLVFLSVITNFKYALIWSGLALLSYATYRDSNYEELLLLTFIEYLVVYLLFIAELHKQKIGKQILESLKNTFLKNKRTAS